MDEWILLLNMAQILGFLPQEPALTLSADVTAFLEDTQKERERFGDGAAETSAYIGGEAIVDRREMSVSENAQVPETYGENYVVNLCQNMSLRGMAEKNEQAMVQNQMGENLVENHELLYQTMLSNLAENSVNSMNFEKQMCLFDGANYENQMEIEKVSGQEFYMANYEPASLCEHDSMAKTDRANLWQEINSESENSDKKIEIRVDMSGMQNYVKEQTDIDSVIDEMQKRLEDALYSCAEGVH